MSIEVVNRLKAICSECGADDAVETVGIDTVPYNDVVGWYDWRNNMPEKLTELWPSLSIEARLAACAVAAHVAREAEANSRCD